MILLVTGLNAIESSSSYYELSIIGAWRADHGINNSEAYISPAPPPPFYISEAGIHSGHNIILLPLPSSVFLLFLSFNPSAY